MSERASGAAIGRPARRRRLSPPARLLRDRYLLYTALLAPVACAAAIVSGSVPDLINALLVTPVFLLIQAWLALVPSRYRSHISATWWSILRLVVAVLFVGGLVNVVGGPSRPLLSLYLPVVVAASALGRPQAVAIGTLTAGIYLTPFLVATPLPIAFAQRAVSHAGVAVLLALATRQLLHALERAGAGLRAAVVAERRRSRQIAAMEQIGRLLVGGGETGALIASALSVLADRVGYEYSSIYLWQGGVLRLGAQRNYAHAPEEVAPGHGVVGRVAQSRELAWIPDVSVAPEYVATASGVVSEICAPLMVEGVLLGVLNVEARRPLDRTDRNLVAALAARLATVLVLSRDRQALAARAALFHSLHEFTSAVSATLDLDALADTVVAWTDRIVPVDLVVVTVLDKESGRYLMRAGKGTSPGTLGEPVRPGEGMAGRAIRDRVTVISGDYGPHAYPESVRGLATTPVRIAAAVPLIRDGAVIGALTIGRVETGGAFAPLEIEGLELLAGHASLALANAFLHAELAALAIRDPLTGLYNRRHFDEALERLVAGHRRHRIGPRQPLAAIMFDLDHFGAFNRDHGHQVGDAVLRTFADILLRRFRAADLVARYGGEEFVAILEDAELEDAQRIAEEVRGALAAVAVADEAGEPLAVTVSAGCAALDETAPSAEGLLRTADVALFMAKRAGRNRVVAA